MKNGKIYVPIDIMAGSKSKVDISIRLDDEGDAPNICVDFLTRASHIEMRFDEERLGRFLSSLDDKYLALIKKRAFQRGAANALKRKK